MPRRFTLCFTLCFQKGLVSFRFHFRFLRLWKPRSREHLKILNISSQVSFVRLLNGCKAIQFSKSSLHVSLHRFLLSLLHNSSFLSFFVFYSLFLLLFLHLFFASFRFVSFRFVSLSLRFAFASRTSSFCHSLVVPSEPEIAQTLPEMNETRPKRFFFVLFFFFFFKREKTFLFYKETPFTLGFEREWFSKRRFQYVSACISVGLLVSTLFSTLQNKLKKTNIFPRCQLRTFSSIGLQSGACKSTATTRQQGQNERGKRHDKTNGFPDRIHFQLTNVTMPRHGAVVV